MAPGADPSPLQFGAGTMVTAGVVREQREQGTTWSLLGAVREQREQGTTCSPLVAAGARACTAPHPPTDAPAPPVQPQLAEAGFQRLMMQELQPAAEHFTASQGELGGGLLPLDAGRLVGCKRMPRRCVSDSPSHPSSDPALDELCLDASRLVGC